MGSTQRQRRTGSSQGSPGASWAVGLLVIACGLLMVGAPASVPVSVRAASMLEPGPQSAHGTLVGYESLDVCAMPTPRQRAAFRAAGYAAPASALETATVTLANPIRKIKDPYPSFAAVSVDVERNEVVFTDESLFQVLVYDRLENTPAGSEASKPKRVIAGRNTNIEFQSGVYVDAKSGEIFAVNNDTRDTTVVFGPGANGDVTPVRSIETAHGTFGIAVAEAHDEVLLTVQHDSAVVAYTKRATGDDKPIRLLQGDRTKLADPHGIAYDPRDDVIFVANFGARSERDASRDGSRGRTSGGRLNWPLGRSQAVLGSGSIGPPSVSIYRRAASGNEAPLRVIQGAATQFDWPTGLAFDPSRRELYVANDMGPSILVFDADAQGNASPRRVLKGTRTRLVNPTSVALDLKNRELWVANFGGHAGLVFDIGASGNASPKRVIRNAPPDAPSLMIGNPGALAYDPKREHLLVPN